MTTTGHVHEANPKQIYCVVSVLYNIQAVLSSTSYEQVLLGKVRRIELYLLLTLCDIDTGGSGQIEGGGQVLDNAPRA